MTLYNSVIFGSVSSAALFDDEGSYIFEPQSSPTPIPCREGDIRWLEELDSCYVEIPDARDLGEIAEELRKEEGRRNALFFLLASFDTNLPNDVRTESAEIIDNLLSDREIAEWVEQIVSAQPLIQGQGMGDLELPQAPRWSMLREKIVGMQPSLLRLWGSIELLKQQESILDGDENIDELLLELLRSNTIPMLASAIEAREVKRFNEAIVGFSLRSDNKQRHPAATKVLTKLRSLLEESNAFREHSVSLFASNESEQRANQKRVQIPPDLSTYEAFSQVRRQIEGIKKLLLTSNRQAVDKAVGSLLEFNSTYGEKEHLAKSLCALTKIALDANEPHIADALSLRAVALETDDIVVLTSRAEVLKSLARFDEAQEMYEATLQRYGKERYALCGYADVLMDQGKFDQALSVYDTAVDLYPEDPVASNGIVGVLMAKGEPSGALQQARKTAERFGDVVSLNILGNVLRHVGRYAESVRVMEAALHRFPTEPRTWVGLLRSLRYAGRLELALAKVSEFSEKFSEIPSPLLIRGEILRAMGRLEESLESYTKALKNFPNHRPAQIGRASILTILGRTEEAERMLEGLELESEADWAAFHVLCVAILRAGKYEQAIEKLSRARESVPWSRVRQMFSDSLGFAKLKAGKAREALSLLTEGADAIEQQKRNVILLFLGSAYIESGNRSAGKRLLQMAKPTDLAGKTIKNSFEISDGTSFNGIVDPRTEAAAYDSLLAYAA